MLSVGISGNLKNSKLLYPNYSNSNHPFFVVQLKIVEIICHEGL